MNLADWLALARRFISANAISVSPRFVPQVVPDEPKDDAILACANAGRAQYIVSGDQHLLRLGRYRGIKIVTPREFVVTVLRETVTKASNFTPQAYIQRFLPQTFRSFCRL